MIRKEEGKLLGRVPWPNNLFPDISHILTDLSKELEKILEFKAPNPQTSDVIGRV